MLNKGRVGIVLTHLPGYSETFFKNKIQGLQENGVEVVLFILENNGKQRLDHNCKMVQAPDLKGNGLNVILRSAFVLIRSLFISPRACYRHFKLDYSDGISLRYCIKRLIRNSFILNAKLDWLHFGFGMLAVGRENIAGAINSKMAVSFRGYDMYLSPLKHPNCYSSLFRKVAQYHVLSEEMKSDLVNLDISAENICVITPAINTDFFSSTNGVKASFDKPILELVSIARLHWKKGLEYTLEAMAILKKKGVNFTYVIIGEGDEKDRLVYTATQLGIDAQVIFKGRLGPDKVKEHLESADIYLQYSIQEGFCNAVLEAQAMGLCTIVSNAEGLSENILHDKTGWVVPKRKPELLANQIVSVLKMSSLERKEILESAVSRVRNNFDLKKQQELFFKFYNF